MRRRRRHVLGLWPAGLRQLGRDRIGLARRRRHGRRFARWVHHVALPDKGMPAGRRASRCSGPDPIRPAAVRWVSEPAAGWAAGLAAADSGAAAAGAVGARAAAGHGPAGIAAACGPWDRSSLALHWLATPPGIGRCHPRNAPLTERVARGLVHPEQLDPQDMEDE